MDQDYESRLLRQINIQNENASPIKVTEVMRTLTPTSSPMSSPSKHGDRFIPSRAGANWSISFHRINENEKSPSQNRKTKDATSDTNKADGLAYSALLKNELLGAGIEKVQDPQTEDRRLQPSTPERRSLFSYSLSAKRSTPDDGSSVSPYSLSPVSSKSQKLLRSPRKPTRKISKIPFKVLDAPELQDDFYLNLVDWSSLNVLSVGLGTCVYLWSACTSQVTRLCDLSVEGDSVTSVGWSERGNLVAVGTHKGLVQIWDAAAGKKLSTLEGHTARVGALAWNADQLSSGSRDRMILQRDIRTPPLQSERRLQGHRQEVCGLKWSTDHQLLASGGNDNKLLVWNHSSVLPVQQYTEHLAAVKAIAWSPHQHGLLASGGGTADRCIRFWNTLTGQPLQCTDTGSQVCNLAWSKHTNELVSTHGYSQNQILVWKYPSLTQVAKLTGHSYRVLYLAMSPDGEAIVTGAGDETLRFWNVFSKTRSTKESVSVLNLFTRIRISMSDRILPEELKRWAIEELNLQPQYLPHDSYFKTMCLGQGASIWKYATQHVYHKRNVKVMRGNLLWFKMLQDKEVVSVEGQGDAARRQGLQSEIEELRAELDQLDCQISVAETQLSADELSVSRRWGKDEERRVRSVKLQAFRQRCAEHRDCLSQDHSTINTHCQALSQLCKKAEVQLVFSPEHPDSLGPTGPEPQVLREVRELCEDRVLFFQSLQESHTTGSHLPHEQRAVVFQLWLSAVEGLLRSHPPSHILLALQHVAFCQQGALQEKLSALDVEREMAALRFRYENQHLQDVSREQEELPSVKSLLQEGWEQVEWVLVQLAQTRTRVQQQQDQLSICRKELLLDDSAQTESLERSVLELELQCVIQTAVRDSVQEQCAQLGRRAQDRQLAACNLRSQWQRIMDFKELVDNKQEQIRELIKANSNSKIELSRAHTEIGQFVQGTLGPECRAAMETTSALRNTVSKETRLAGAVPLTALNRRVIQSLQRIPAEWLSISRLRSQTFPTLCQTLAFPVYRAPEQLTAQAVSQQLELRFLRRLLQLHTLSKASLQGQGALLPAPDLQALLHQVQESDQEVLQSLLPRVRGLKQCSSQGLLYRALAKSAVTHWWEQPAQFALPEAHKQGLTLQKWLQRWRLAAKALDVFPDAKSAQLPPNLKRQEELTLASKLAS
ncbi:hypothetical protein AAFF_G00228220 [Aldrovandia affinis]|uniref:Fizzy-related protein homolog n=1 Tax=Aldrovandia affinis TaxID=143900 RepID=A0AAD7WTZ8_9TELE|nr:hypothetical protein AAFF_G00228220 [Aldrovandia affinis]